MLLGAALIIGGGQLLTRYMFEFDMFSYIFGMMGIPMSWVAAAAGIIALAVAAYRINTMDSYTVSFSGDRMTYKGGGALLKTEETIPFSRIRRAEYKELPIAGFGDLIIDTDTDKPGKILVQYVTNVRARCEALNRIVRGEPSEMPIPSYVRQENPEIISFKEEVIGYIEDELNQGYGLEQIKKDLLTEGYPPQIIEFATNYVAQHNKMSQKEKQKTVPKTEKHHTARRFHIPVLGIAALIFVLMVIFFITGIGSGDEKKELPEKIDIFLYDSLGITPGQQRIAGSTQLYARDETIERARAEALLEEKRTNPTMQNLGLSGAVNGFEKRATIFDITGRGFKKKTLVEIRFMPDEAVKTLKIVESIPKTIATAEEIELTQGGILADKDPVIIFTFNDVEIGKPLKATYVISKEAKDFDTLTFPAEEKQTAQKPKEPAVCGDGRCVPGESFISCCTDCGCPPGSMCESNSCLAAERDQCQTETECSDNDISTRDTCLGRPKTCQHTAITECVNADMYCPEGCQYETDTDCTPPQTTLPTASPGPYDAAPDIAGEQEPPDILFINITPEETTIGGEVMIEAKATDPNGREDLVRVWVEIMELAQSHGEIGDMFDDGEYGDATAVDDVYTAVLVVSDYYLTGTYHANVFAQDSAGNKKKMQKTFRVIG